MTDNTIQQAKLLQYEVVAIDEVEQRLNNGYSLHGSPVYDSGQGQILQAVTTNEPLALQGLSHKKRRVYTLHKTGMKRAEIAEAMNLQPKTVTAYILQIKQLLNRTL